MIQGLYLASQAMTVMMDKQEQVANNLANINTTGFKESSLFAQTYQKYLADDQLNPKTQSEIKPDQVYVNYSEGTAKKTGGSLDLLLKGSGFFTVMTPDGVGYTRNGNFALDPEGFLVTNEGNKVMSTEGYVKVDTTKPLTFGNKGEIYQEDGLKAVLKISDFEKPYRLERTGSSFFRPALPDNPVIQSAGYEIRQGFLESSNVNIIKNMVAMITAFRSYEADQKAAQAQDETLQKAINDVGRPV